MVEREGREGLIQGVDYAVNPQLKIFFLFRAVATGNVQLHYEFMLALILSCRPYS
jgi:hypothetical protein